MDEDYGESSWEQESYYKLLKWYAQGLPPRLTKETRRLLKDVGSLSWRKEKEVP